MFSARHNSLNIILLIVLIGALLALSGWLAYHAGRNVAEGEALVRAQQRIIQNPTEVVLTTISLAENARLEDATGITYLDIEGGRGEVDVVLPENIGLPEGMMFEAWLVDAGKLGGLGTSSVSEQDQQFGTPFANLDFSGNVDAAPYAHSMGTLVWDAVRGSYHVYFETHNMLTPYDAVMVTVESDGNQQDYDPRPGTPILIGEITLAQ